MSRNALLAIAAIVFFAYATQRPGVTVIPTDAPLRRPFFVRRM